MAEELKVGDTVRVKDPDEYIVSFANKVRDRDAVVEFVGPDEHRQFKGRVRVMFQKRNGRGKEFREMMRSRDLIKQ